MSSLKPGQQWFAGDRYGLFLHWGPYAAIGRGEQVLFREHLDPRAYEEMACAWNPDQFDADTWAHEAVRGGFRYAVLTTRHHDGYCLWDSALTDYTSARQAPRRDYVREYTDAFRKAGLRVGLYYSWLDWRVPAYWEGPKDNPAGWETFRAYVHGQVEELLTAYGRVDEFWFDGHWPHSAQDWDAPGLVARMRQWQPDILINNRLGHTEHAQGNEDAAPAAGQEFQSSATMGDFGTPEHHITAESRPWESCQTTTWRLWCHTHGERWRSAAQWLDFLCESASKGGNLLLNVGPMANGALPPEFLERNAEVGLWLEQHGEAIYGTTRGDVVEFVTRGYQTVRENTLYLIIRFWDPSGKLRVPGLANKVKSARLLHPATQLAFTQDHNDMTGREVIITGLPTQSPTPLFPVIALELDGPPEALPLFQQRLWTGDARRMTAWARQRGETVYALK